MSNGPSGVGSTREGSKGSVIRGVEAGSISVFGGFFSLKDGVVGRLFNHRRSLHWGFARSDIAGCSRMITSVHLVHQSVVFHVENNATLIHPGSADYDTMIAERHYQHRTDLFCMSVNRQCGIDSMRDGMGASWPLYALRGRGFPKEIGSILSLLQTNSTRASSITQYAVHPLSNEPLSL